MSTNPKEFSDLPTKIRLIIWRLTFPGPRTVKIQVQREKDQSFAGWKVDKETPDAWPVALKVCRESRCEALSHYILSFGTTNHPARTYFNYEIDTLYFSPENPWGHGSTIDFLLNLWHGNDEAVGNAAIQAEKIRYAVCNFNWEDEKCPPWPKIRLLRELEKLQVGLKWMTDEPYSVDDAVEKLRSSLRKEKDKFPDWTVPSIEVVLDVNERYGHFSHHVRKLKV